MKASSLKKGSIIKALSFIPSAKGVTEKWVTVSIDRTTDKFVWFKGGGYQRIARATIDSNPKLYKIVKL